MIDLTQFCGDEPLRDYLHKPWSKGDFSYATDGRVLVRVPRREDVPIVENNPAAVEKIFRDHFKPCACALRKITLPPAKERKVECIDCAGRGKEHDCPDCDCECQSCDGVGMVNKTESVSVAIAGATFAARYVRLIQKLPNIRVPESAGATDPMPFQFDGGEGILMPIRGECETHIKEGSEREGSKPEGARPKGSTRKRESLTRRVAP